jgi:uncharacterized protein YbjT (DUF2867 family)
VDKSSATIVVTGATGRQGGAVTRQLLANGWRVRALTRDVTKPAAHALALDGADVVPGDQDDAAGLADTMKGAYGVFSVQAASGSDVAPDFQWADEVRWGKNVADAARAADVQSFVYTSVNGAAQSSGLPVLESKREIEAYITDLGLPTTVIRPTSFMENYARPKVGLVQNGKLATALRPDVGQQLIALRDIAAFAVLAFEDPATFVGRRIELAGDDLTPPQIADAISRAVGRTIPYVEVSIDDLRDRKESENVARGYEWLNGRKMAIADRAALRAMHPGLMTFQTWLDTGGAQLIKDFLQAQST